MTLASYAPPLARVLRRFPGTTPAAVLAEVRAGRAQLWDAGEGNVIVSQLRSEPGGEVCVMWLAAGELAPLIEKHEEIVRWAKGQGCVRMRIIGRRGWLKVLSSYREMGVVMERSI